MTLSNYQAHRVAGRGVFNPWAGFHGVSTMSIKFSGLDVLELPDPQRAVFLHLARHGPADVESLAAATGYTPAEVEQALVALTQQGVLAPTAQGMLEAAFGRITPRTSLPAQLDGTPAATGRLYSEQEVAVLNTALPMLQFARARLTEFADHGPSHALRVKSFATQLGYLLGLTPAEQHLLRAACLFHDVGNVVDRRHHHEISQHTVEKLATLGELPFIPKEAELVGLLCRWHRGEYEPERVDRLREAPIRTGLLASILRVADAMDIDQRRSDYGRRFRKVLAFFFEEHLPFWSSLEQVLGVRIHCGPAVELQVFTLGEVADNMQIDMLRRDLESTPLGWSVRAIPVSGLSPEAPDRPDRPAPSARQGGAALLVFPFEAHSLVMAALSRKQLAAAGGRAELLCYPDTADAAAWLWDEALPHIQAGYFTRLVLIGGRPGTSASDLSIRTLERWRAAGVSISVLGRHEAGWPQLPRLLALGVEVILGGDWAYFWGDAPGQTDLDWARVAALCSRDPLIAATRIGPADEALRQGLLYHVYAGLHHPPEDMGGWLALAEPILDRIAADDQDYFLWPAVRFAEQYAVVAASPQSVGRALLFREPPGVIPPASYWAMEQAIEQRGRVPVCRFAFNVPYALGVWPAANGEVELLAINHWREEEAIPIRFLYPAGLGPAPHGHEGIVHVRLARQTAEAVVDRLLAACNAE
jgi:hypothetical protein